MTSAYLGNYFEAHLLCPREGWYKGICLCTDVTQQNGAALFKMVDKFNNVFHFTAANIIRPVVMKNTPKYKVGDLVYANVSFQAGFSYDCQADCRITEVKVSFDEITYLAVVDGSNENVNLYESNVIRLATAKPPKPSREQQLAALREHEQMLLSQLNALRSHMGSI